VINFNQYALVLNIMMPNEKRGVKFLCTHLQRIISDVFLTSDEDKDGNKTSPNRFISVHVIHFSLG